ncbi:hypothetical protein SAMN06265222_11595 [Neorhodopirellula lusitana]|uniref:Uncharacterized protein n=1 Tax=Neorhodopirellula lusitana TaxID=445327 RepID=A0ABY1QKY2_9BACT|nr:hypothetical protein SAMN06265222_11595 [Neorhodopirellula lusitana]
MKHQDQTHATQCVCTGKVGHAQASGSNDMQGCHSRKALPLYAIPIRRFRFFETANRNRCSLTEIPHGYTQLSQH